MQSPESDLTPWTLTLISNLIVAKNGGNAQLGFEYGLLDGPSDLLVIRSFFEKISYIGCKSRYLGESELTTN